MPEPQNNFLIFNENNNQGTTLSQGDYLALAYRISGLIPMIADPIAHNKMFRQWSLMCNAIGAMINDKNLDALDTNSSDLKDNLKLTVKGLARDELQSDITTNANNITTNANNITALQTGKADIGHTHLTADITDITATSTEINYLSGANSNIQQQINNLNISAFFPLWTASRAYSVGDVVKTLTSSFWFYLECVVTGTSDTTEPTFTNVGELVTDGTVKWLVLDLRDSAPVGTIKQDIIKRDGWLKLNGATVNVADYPRLVSFLTANSLIHAYTVFPVATDFTYGDSNNETLVLPNFEGLFIENSASDTLDGVSAGLPNIIGNLSSLNGTEDPETSTGVFYWQNTAQYLQEKTEAGNYKGKSGLRMDASRSNSIYGNSNTVQPPAVKLIPVIKY